MDKIVKSGASALSARQTSDKALSMCAPLSRVNMIKTYPMSDEEIIDWALTIERIDPLATKEEISDVMDGFMSGKYEFDKELGIRNVFKALKRLRNGDREETIFNIP